MKFEKIYGRFQELLCISPSSVISMHISIILSAHPDRENFSWSSPTGMIQRLGNILRGYERRMGDESTEEHREKINNLPIDSDGKVTYEVFLRNYLLEREQVGVGHSCWNMSAKEKKYFDVIIDFFGINFLH